MGESLESDVNADGLVDVKDIQVVVAVLHGGAESAADVNGDGAVDIRDLQQVVADRIEGKKSEGEPLPAENAIPPSSTPQHRVFLHPDRWIAVLLEGDNQPASETIDGDALRVFHSLRVYRSLFGLSAHAPPSAA